MFIRICVTSCCWTRSTRWKKCPVGPCPSVLTQSHECASIRRSSSSGAFLAMLEPPLSMPGHAGRSCRPILERELLLRALTSAETEALAAYKAWRATVDFSGPIDPETAALLPQLYEALLKLELDDPLLGIFAGVSRRAWYENHTLLASVQQALECLAR